MIAPAALDPRRLRTRRAGPAPDESAAGCMERPGPLINIVYVHAPCGPLPTGGATALLLTRQH